jgi:hypothetical protein
MGCVDCGGDNNWDNCDALEIKKGTNPGTKKAAVDDTGVVLIVFWVVVVNPLVGCAIGERKGNVATGIILGLLLGPIGWLVTAMCFSNLRKCPFCSEDIKPDAKVCRYCGRDLPPAQR